MGGVNVARSLGGARGVHMHKAEKMSTHDSVDIIERGIAIYEGMRIRVMLLNMMMRKCV